MCFGFSIYFSKKIVPSPKAVKASPCASLNSGIKSSALRTTRIPRPPPPAAALTMMGKPIREASFIRISSLVISALLSPMMGTLTLRAIFLAATLSPNRFMTSALGPIKIMPSSSQRLAKFTFSDKKP